MPVRIDNLSALVRDKERLAVLRDGGKKVIARSISTLRRRIKPEAKREIVAKFNLKPSLVVKRLRCLFDKTSVSLAADGVRTYLKNFGPVQDAQGIVVTIVLGQQLSLPHGFMRRPGGYSGSRHYKDGTALVRIAVAQACVAGGGEWVTAQAVPGGPTDRHGYPLAMLLGPSVGQMLAYAGIEDDLADFAQQTFSAEVDRLLEVARRYG
jgi:hypothetical protein